MSVMRTRFDAYRHWGVPLGKLGETDTALYTAALSVCCRQADDRCSTSLAHPIASSRPLSPQREWQRQPLHDRELGQNLLWWL